MFTIRHAFAAAAAAVVALGLVSAAQAEVASARADGFKVLNSVKVAAAPDKVWAALVRPADWWSPAHSWSGKAANVSLDARAGGCFCERLDNGGSVQHARVVYADPAGLLRLRGGLGPLQALGMDGVLTWTIKAEAGGGSTIEQSYIVAGHMEGGAQALAPVVDGVMALQLARLGRLLDTGRPQG